MVMVSGGGARRKSGPQIMGGGGEHKGVNGIGGV